MRDLRPLFRSLSLIGLVLFPTLTHAKTDPDCASFRIARTSGEVERTLEVLRALDPDRTLDSATEAVHAVKAIREWLEIGLGLRIEKPLEVRICARLPGTLGERSPTWGAFEENADLAIVTLKNGLSARRLLQVAAHELVHAWQAENCPPGQRLETHEGFAQWGAGELLKAVGLEDDFRILASREDLYGEAYRWIASIEEREGRDALLNYVRTAP